MVGRCGKVVGRYGKVVGGWVGDKVVGGCGKVARLLVY